LIEKQKKMKQHDFTKLPYNPLALKRGELMQEVYLELARREVFSVAISEAAFYDGFEENTEGGKGKPKAKPLVNKLDNAECLSDMLKFIVLFIDKNSPFWNERNINYRTDVCLRYAEIKKGTRAYENITSGSDWYMSLILEYFIFVNDRMYEEWLSQVMSHRTLCHYLRMPNLGDDPEKSVKAHADLQARLSSVSASISTLELQLFPNDKQIQATVASAAARKQENNSILGYAERFALKRT
jgi:hypothetical protein